MQDHKRKRGPEPETLKIEGDWEEAVKKAIHKPPARRTPKKTVKHKGRSTGK